jgi:hypothetical protein
LAQGLAKQDASYYVEVCYVLCLTCLTRVLDFSPQTGRQMSRPETACAKCRSPSRPYRTASATRRPYWHNCYTDKSLWPTGQMSTLGRPEQTSRRRDICPHASAARIFVRTRRGPGQMSEPEIAPDKCPSHGQLPANPTKSLRSRPAPARRTAESAFGASRVCHRA